MHPTRLFPCYNCYFVNQSPTHPYTSVYSQLFLPPATKLGQGYVFTGVCDSVHRGGVPDQVHPPDQVPPLGPGTPPRTRYTPWTRYTPRDQVHPPGPGTPPGTRYTPPRTRYTPLDQVHPPGTRYTPRDQVHPPDQVPPLGPGTPPPTRYTPTPPDQGDTVYAWAVRILLECNLVTDVCPSVILSTGGPHVTITHDALGHRHPS